MWSASERSSQDPLFDLDRDRVENVIASCSGVPGSA